MTQAVTCPHCGDVTEQSIVLEEFVCGNCDKPFRPGEFADPRVAVAIALVAIDDINPPIVRRNKARTDGLLFEVVTNPHDDVPISEETIKVLSVFETANEAADEADRLYDSARALVVQQYGDDRAREARAEAIADLIKRAEDHYWDSLESNADIVLTHLRALAAWPEGAA